MHQSGIRQWRTYPTNQQALRCCYQRYLFDKRLRDLACQHVVNLADVGRVSRVSPVQTAMRNCTRDEGRSFEAGSQVPASNRCKLLSSRAMVVSVAVNVGRISRRVRLREASASEPPMNCRKRFRRCQNRGVTLPPGSARENPEACPSGIRHVGGAKLNQALVRNVRTYAPMQRERSQAAQTARIRVPMRSIGAEQPVVGTKAL